MQLRVDILICHSLSICVYQASTEAYKYADVYPANVTNFTLGGLALGTDYLFGIMAFNDLGESNYTTDVVKAKTSSKNKNLCLFVNVYF